MEMESCSVPPGFRFHPTEEELVGYYLKRKINSLKIDLDVIIDLDLYKIEPWDIQERCKLGYEEQKEWYFFSHKDKKYPTGMRTNRATAAGFWKATGRDKAVVSKINKIVGMRKTLVFYKGRAPNGRKTDWIMHEYRLQTSQNAPPQEEGWVVCRAFKKPTPTHRPGFEPWNHFNHLTNNTHLFNPPSNSSNLGNPSANYFQPFNSDQDQHISNLPFLDTHLLELPQLESPTCTNIPTSHATKNGAIVSEDFEEERSKNGGQNCNIDWKILDSFFGSQVGDDAASVSSHPNLALMPHDFELEAHVSSFLGCFPNS